jgi:hypothetical protein
MKTVLGRKAITESEVATFLLFFSDSITFLLFFGLSDLIVLQNIFSEDVSTYFRVHAIS